MANTFKSQEAWDAWQQALQDDKAYILKHADPVIVKAWEAHRGGQTLSEYLDDYLERPGIFEGVASELGVPYDWEA